MSSERPDANQSLGLLQTFWLLVPDNRSRIAESCLHRLCTIGQSQPPPHLSEISQQLLSTSSRMA